MKTPPENSQEQEDNHPAVEQKEIDRLEKLTVKIGFWAEVLGRIVATGLTILALFKNAKKS